MKRIILLVVLSLAAANASACKCIQQTLAEAFDRAPIAFVGTLREGQDLPERPRGTVTYEVTRALKGDVRAGTPIKLDPWFGTDCTAPLIPGASVLVFAYPGTQGAPSTNACGSWLAAPVRFEGKDYQPAREVSGFLSSLRVE